MHDGSLPKWQGSGGLVSTDGLERLGLPLVNLGMQDFGSDGPVMACSLWGCADGLEKYCCLWRFALCWTGGSFKCIGCMCSFVLQYFLAWASMM